MNDILARRARRATVGIALSAALVAGIAPVTAIAAETSSPTGAVALQTEDAAAAKEKAYAAMQEALKPGDIVLTQSGLYGVLTSLENTTAHLRLTNGFEIVIDRFSIKEPAAPEAARAAQTVQ